MELYNKPKGVKTHWISFENRTSECGLAGLENKGAKGHPCDRLNAGETKTLLDVEGSGSIRRIWMTINDRSPEMLRSLRLEMFWDAAETPAVSVPLGDFFGIGLGRTVPFECALFSNPEGRSFNCFIPMPFRTGAKVSITNESDTDLPFLFYDIDILLGEDHSMETMYFHAHWRRESPNELGREFVILPKVSGCGRFLGCNVGVITAEGYKGSWFGEGEVKCWFGDDENPTICGTGTEDYIGTGWGQGTYAQRTQGCPIADKPNRQYAFYRYHIDDPLFFDDGIKVAIQTIGGSGKAHVIEMLDSGMPGIPVSLSTEKQIVNLLDLDPPQDIRSPDLIDGWCNFWRQDDWSATAYLYLETPGGYLPPIAPASERTVGLALVEGTSAREDA